MSMFCLNAYFHEEFGCIVYHGEKYHGAVPMSLMPFSKHDVALNWLVTRKKCGSLSSLLVFGLFGILEIR